MSLKHDVMYHHGMGGPPQRPLQVRKRCMIIVDRRTNVFLISRSKRASKYSVNTEQNENGFKPNNFTNNWTHDKRLFHIDLKFQEAHCVMTATLYPWCKPRGNTRERRGNVNWVVSTVLCFSIFLIVNRKILFLFFPAPCNWFSSRSHCDKGSWTTNGLRCNINFH